MIVVDGVTGHFSFSLLHYICFFFSSVFRFLVWMYITLRKKNPINDQTQCLQTAWCIPRAWLLMTEQVMATFHPASLCSSDLTWRFRQAQLLCIFCDLAQSLWFCKHSCYSLECSPCQCLALNLPCSMSPSSSIPSPSCPWASKSPLTPGSNHQGGNPHLEVTGLWTSMNWA